MKNLRVIIFMPSIEGGGVEKNLFVIANYLSTKINDLSIITISNKYKKKFNNKINFISPRYNFWDNLGRRKKYFLALFFLLIEYFKKKKFIVFCFQANIYCTLLCKFLGIKIIIRSNSSPSGWSQNVIKKFIFTQILNMADRVIVNSIKFKNEINKKFKIKAVYIYNPLDKKKIIKLSKKKIKFNFFKKKYLNLINVGRLVDQKDQLTLLNAAKILKTKKFKFKLLIIGSGIYENKIKKFIYLNKLSDNIKLLPFNNNPFPYILKSDLFVLTSIYEGLPNVLLESIVLGKFVISSDCPTGPSEILDNGKGGLLFKTGDHQSLAEKIIKYKKNIFYYKKKLLFAKKRLIRFDYDKNLAKYFDIIISI